MPEDLERKDRLRKALHDQQLDAVFCTSPSEVLLLTGYWPIFATSVAVFTREGEVHVVLPADEQELAQKTTKAQLTAYHPELLDRLTDPIHQLRSPLTELIGRLGLRQARIGLRQEIGVQPASYAVMTDFRTSLHTLLGELLPAATFVSCDTMIEGEKAVRTTHELDRLRTGSRVAADAFAQAETLIRPGLRETEVAAALQAIFEASPAAMALERSYGFFFCMSGPNAGTAAAAYARTRQRTLGEGDLVMIHANTCADGLWTDITRTYTVGTATPRHNEIRSAVLEARKAALQVIRPGVAAREVDAAARQVMEQRGFGKAFVHATGHGVGYAAANANALPRIHPQSPDVLTAGMTFNIEPAAYFGEHGGMRHCDVVVVTASGALVLTDF